MVSSPRSGRRRFRACLRAVSMERTTSPRRPEAGAWGSRARLRARLGGGLACEPAWGLGLACEPAWGLGLACEPAWGLGLACEPAWEVNRRSADAAGEAITHGAVDGSRFATPPRYLLGSSLSEKSGGRGAIFLPAWTISRSLLEPLGALGYGVRLARAPTLLPTFSCVAIRDPPRHDDVGMARDRALQLPGAGQRRRRPACCSVR